MADQVLTKQKLINADEDLGDLEEVLNGPPGKLIKTRLGREVYTLASVPQINTMTREEVAAAVAPKANKADVDEALSNLSTTANKYYSTLAEANSDIANIAVNQAVAIGEEANGGLWYKATEGATSLTKSPYDALQLAKAYADALKLLLDYDVSKNRDSIARLLVSMQSLVMALNTESADLNSKLDTESTDLNSKINDVKDDLNDLLTTNLKVDDALTQHLTAIQVLVKTIESQSGNINLNTEYVKDQLVATHLLVKQLSEVEGGSSPTSLGVHRGKFTYGASYNVGELFDHGSGTYNVLTKVISASVTPDQDPSYSKISGILSTNNLKTLTISNVTVEAEVERDVIPTSISHDGTKLWSHSTNVLRESLDGGLTWDELHSFSNLHFIEWVKELDNGELLLQVIYFVYEGGQTKIRDRYSIYRTSGKGTESMTLVECFSIEPEGVFAHHAWSVSIHNNIVLVGEYGAKVPTWAGKPVEDGDNARYARLSTDYGKTWKIIFDLNERSETPSNEGLHLHGVCYDQYWNRIWVTHGDGFWGETATLYSDDLGETWTYAHRYKKIDESNTATDGYRHQNVGIVALPDCVLFGSDGFPDGVQRIDRAHGKHTTNGLYPIDIAYFVDNGQSSINYVCSSISYAKNTEFSPVLFGFTAETTAAKSCVIGTYDGFDFFKLWEDSLVQPTGKGLDFVCGVTLRNEVIIRSNDSRTTGTGKRTKITLKV